MIPIYLNDLNLPQVFSSYSNAIDSYLCESDKSNHIVDSRTNGISGFVSPTFGVLENVSGKYFSVEDVSRVSYVLLQIDNGLIKSSSTKKCDCAIANDQIFSFIEFKTEAYSSNPRTVANNHLKAMEQLLATIRLFDSFYQTQGLNIRRMRSVDAFICFRQGYPRHNSSQMFYRTAFLSRSQGIPLSFARKKVL